MINLQSNDKKILIVSDVHNEINKLDKIIKYEAADINIVLGDLYDSFIYDSPNNYIDTTFYLRDNFLFKPNNYSLFGNHDLHYLFNNKHVICSGYEPWKYDLIDGILGKFRDVFRKKFHWTILLDDILLTHAGLDRRLIPPLIKTNQEVYDYLSKSEESVYVKLISQDHHWFYQVGHIRGGQYNVGGIVWCDFNSEFEPIDELRQIVGHTNQYKSHKIKQHDSEGFSNILDANNLCIDCGLSEYITLTYGKLEIKKYNNI
jgi:hypothetical protein